MPLQLVRARPVHAGGVLPGREQLELAALLNARAGDRIHIKVDPTTDTGNTNGTLALELDTDFLPTS